jgi:hypothetical protein
MFPAIGRKLDEKHVRKPFVWKELSAVALQAFRYLAGIGACHRNDNPRWSLAPPKEVPSMPGVSATIVRDRFCDYGRVWGHLSGLCGWSGPACKQRQLSTALR